MTEKFPIETNKPYSKIAFRIISFGYLSIVDEHISIYKFRSILMNRLHSMLCYGSLNTSQRCRVRFGCLLSVYSNFNLQVKPKMFPVINLCADGSFDSGGFVVLARFKHSIFNSKWMKRNAISRISLWIECTSIGSDRLLRVSVCARAHKGCLHMLQFIWKRVSFPLASKFHTFFPLSLSPFPVRLCHQKQLQSVISAFKHKYQFGTYRRVFLAEFVVYTVCATLDTFGNLRKIFCVCISRQQIKVIYINVCFRRLECLSCVYVFETSVNGCFKIFLFHFMSVSFACDCSFYAEAFVYT